MERTNETNRRRERWRVRSLGGDELAAAGRLAPLARLGYGIEAFLPGCWQYQRQGFGGNRLGLEHGDGVELLEVGHLFALAHSGHVAAHPVTPLAGRFDGMEGFSHRSTPTDLRYSQAGSLARGSPR